jgi:hypothetical protein
MQLPRKPIPILILALLFRNAEANTSIQTIASLTEWQNLDPCAQSCFQHGEGVGCTWAPLDSNALGCGAPYCSEQAANDCYCRSDKQAVATSYLSSCIKKACTIGDPLIDINSGVSIYEGYCTSLGYLAAPANVAATTTGGTYSTSTVSFG